MRRPKVIPRIGRTRLLLFLAILGPGLITASADNDAGGIATYSVAGGNHGYSMLWVLVLIMIALAVTQEMGARMGIVSGQGLAALIRERFRVRVTLLAMLTDELLQQRYNVKEFVRRRKPSFFRPLPPELVEELATSCDVVITGVGD